jgi:hypothetical protein
VPPHAAEVARAATAMHPVRTTRLVGLNHFMASAFSVDLNDIVASAFRRKEFACSRSFISISCGGAARSEGSRDLQRTCRPGSSPAQGNMPSRGAGKTQTDGDDVGNAADVAGD